MFPAQVKHKALSVCMGPWFSFSMYFVKICTGRIGLTRAFAALRIVVGWNVAKSGPMLVTSLICIKIRAVKKHLLLYIVETEIGWLGYMHVFGRLPEKRAQRVELSGKGEAKAANGNSFKDEAFNLSSHTVNTTALCQNCICV